MRLIIDDPTMNDPLALITTAKLAAMTDAVSTVKDYLKASGDAQLTLSPNCVFAVGEQAPTSLFVTAQTALNASNLDTGIFASGRDYYVYVCDNGTNNEQYYISLNTTFPAGFNAANSRKIGGFHYGKCRRVDSMKRPVNSANAVYGAGWESNVYDGIVPGSVWTLKHRPKCAPEGMTYIGSGVWVDIYLSSNDGAGGVQSVFNAAPLTGTEGHNWYSFNDRALQKGKRLPNYSEFCRMAYGSPQGNAGDNVNAWSASSNTGRNPTGQVANAVSAIGTRDAVGNVWEWLDEFVTRASGVVLNGTTSPGTITYGAYDGGRAGSQNTTGTNHGPTTRSNESTPDNAQGAWGWDKDTPLGDTTGGNQNNGNIYEYFDWSLVALIGGGDWADGVGAGCRAVGVIDYPWHVHTFIGARFACDSL